MAINHGIKREKYLHVTHQPYSSFSINKLCGGCYSFYLNACVTIYEQLLCNYCTIISKESKKLHNFAAME